MKLGVQCQEKGERIYTYNRIAQPNNIKAINVADTDFWQRIWDENPRLKYAIYREERPDKPDPFADPEGAAAEWANILLEKVGHLAHLGLITHVEGYNEWLHSYQTDRFDDADLFMEALVDQVHTAFDGKVHACVLNASCGHFANDILEFPKTLAALHACGKCFLGLHEYDREDMDRHHREDLAKGGSGFWLCGKFKRVEQALRGAGYDKVKLAITEVGLDDAVDRPAGSHHRGWQYYGDTVEQAAAHYLNERNLAWYYPLLVESEMTELASIFGCQMYYADNWGEMGFDIRFGFPTLLHGIKNLETASPPTNGGNDMEIKVYDFTHNPFDPAAPYRDMGWLRSIFGDVQVHPIEEQMTLEPGQLIAKVAWLDCRVGDVAVMLHVEKEGEPMAGVVGVFGWPGAEPHSLPYDWPLWTDNGAVGVPTDADGDAGLGGYGKGAYYSPDQGERGPHWIWLHTFPSDIVVGLGMLVGHPEVEGNHLHVNVGYKIVAHGEEPPEPPPTSDHAQRLLDAVAKIEEGLGEVKDVAGELQPGGINSIVVNWEGGGTQTFEPVTSLMGSFLQAVKRLRR